MIFCDLNKCVEKSNATKYQNMDKLVETLFSHCYHNRVDKFEQIFRDFPGGLLNYKYKDGMTILHIATQFNCVSMCKTLLEAGMEANR